ncbi:MAG: plastocyanin/azurin family copper-binding protein [Methanoregula sp.]
MKYTPEKVYWVILVVILGTFITVAGCTGTASVSPSTPTTTASTPAPVTGAVTVNIQNFAFSPASITISHGTTVTWVNQDSVNHQILNDAAGTFAEGALFSSDSLLNGKSYSFTFDTPGTYPYHCSIHPYMKGTVIVT